MIESPTEKRQEANVSYRQTFIASSFLACFLLLLTACGGIAPAPLSISPNTSTIQSAQSMQFTAKLVGITSSAVTWSAAYGSISPSGLYIAPTVTSPKTDTITAISAADHLLYATASVVIQQSKTTTAGGSTPVITVSVSPSSETLQSGATQQFTAKVTGTSNTAVTWTAQFGTVSSSGLYTSPKVSTDTVDTISAIGVADPGKYAISTVTVQASATTGGGGTAGGGGSSGGGSGGSGSGGSGGTGGGGTGGGTSSTPYSLTSQQPLTPVAYSSNPASITGKRLPSDVLSHLWGNTSSVAASNGYGKCITTDCGATPTGGAGSPWGTTSYSSDGNYGTTAFYWSQATDPWWIVNGCTYCVSGWTSGPFHLASNALWPGANYSGDADAQFTVWDQATGVVVSVYGAPGFNVPTTIGACPGGGHAGTAADPCVFPSSYYSSASAVSSFSSSRDWQSTNPSGQGNLTSSLGFAPNAGTVRIDEITAGVIEHAEYDSTDCVSAPGGTKLPAVFPGTGTPGTLSCSAVGKQQTYRPQEGMLYFADYSDAQLACLDPAQPVCQYSDSTNIPKVQPFQMIYLTRFAHYGSYIGETSNSSTALAEYAGWHDDVATSWEMLGNPLGSPFWSWANNVETESGSNYMNCVGSRPGTNPSAQTCTISTYVNIPQMPGLSGATDQSGNSCTVAHGCDLSGHIQVADPCVAVALAGLSSSGGVNACP